MYPEYMLIQIVEIPQNGDLPPYAVRFLGRMDHFDYDFMCKNTLKKWFLDHNLDSGEYIIIRDNEQTGDKYVTEGICIYRSKDTGNFLEFKRPGEEWIELVNSVMENTEVINVGMKIQTIKKVTVPKFGVENSTPEGC